MSWKYSACSSTKLSDDFTKLVVEMLDIRIKWHFNFEKATFLPMLTASQKGEDGWLLLNTDDCVSESAGSSKLYLKTPYEGPLCSWIYGYI